MDSGQKMSKGISHYSFWHSPYYDNDVIFCRIFLMSIAISPKTTICWLPAQVPKITLEILTSCTSTRIQLSGVLKEHWKDTQKRGQYCCPQAARAVPLVCQNDKVESSRSTEKILRSGDNTVVLKEHWKDTQKRGQYRCPKMCHHISLGSWKKNVEGRIAWRGRRAWVVYRFKGGLAKERWWCF